MSNIYTLHEAADKLKQPYHRIWYATIRHVVEPQTFGRHLTLTSDDIETLKKHFATKAKAKGGK